MVEHHQVSINEKPWTQNNTNKQQQMTATKLVTQRVCGSARGVMVIVVGNEHGDTSSNPGRD